MAEQVVHKVSDACLFGNRVVVDEYFLVRIWMFLCVFALFCKLKCIRNIARKKGLYHTTSRHFTSILSF